MTVGVSESAHLEPESLRPSCWSSEGQSGGPAFSLPTVGNAVCTENFRDLPALGGRLGCTLLEAALNPSSVPLVNLIPFIECTQPVRHCTLGVIV